MIFSQLQPQSPMFPPFFSNLSSFPGPGFACAQVNQGRQVNSSDARVSKCPTTTRPRRERVMVTFRRRGSPRKPTRPVVLARTVLTKIKSWR